MKYGVSYDDIIEARPNDEEEKPVFIRVVRKSGHRTLRVIFDESIQTILLLQGCSGSTPIPHMTRFMVKVLFDFVG